MRAPNHLISYFRRTRATLQPVARRTDATIQIALMTALAAVTGVLECILGLFQLTWTRLRLLPRGEEGYTTQVVIMTALLAALAIAAGAIIYIKVIDKANSIDLNGNSGTGS